MASDKALDLEFEGPQGIFVEGDVVKVRRIAQNLILNALKYTAKGRIRVQWKDGQDPESASWEFVVTDTGPGIPDMLLKNLIHSRTPQLEPAQTEPENDIDVLALRPSKGEGIGLFIVKRLLELLQGDMVIESNPESGSAFRIILPKSY